MRGRFGLKYVQVVRTKPNGHRSSMRAMGGRRRRGGQRGNGATGHARRKTEKEMEVKERGRSAGVVGEGG